MAQTFDESRFIEALTRHQPALEAYCHASLANHEDAREVFQSISIKLWQKASDWNPETEFLPWAFAVARFSILSHVRDRMRDRLVFDEDILLKMQAETERASSEFDSRREALGRCMKKLNPDQSSLLQEHYVTGRTLKEIAHATRRSESAVKMTVLRLRQQLSECIERQMRTTP